MKNTKIICSIGPASLNKKIIKKMYQNGMDACRINLSHGDFDQYNKIIKIVRSVSNQLVIILDTQGPEIRTQNEETITFKQGEEISFKISQGIHNKLSKDDKILLNDGLNQGVITRTDKEKVYLKMNDEGLLNPNQSIILPGKDLGLPLLTKWDKKGLKLAKKNSLGFIALSYTRSAKEIKQVRKQLKSSIGIIAKIEDKTGVDNINEIIKEADAILIARGDLGAWMPSEQIPIIQKKIINKCNKAGKPVIVATQMMESMIHNKKPTRAETSDVANAIIDGADAVMLSGETSTSPHPALVVKKMNQICRKTEQYWTPKSFEVKEQKIPDIITNNAYLVARKLNAKIICLTRSGYTARMISRFKPKKTIFAVTPNELVSKQLMISYGVHPIHYDKSQEVVTITKYCLKQGLINSEDLVVFTAGLFVKKTTNTVIAFKINELT